MILTRENLLAYTKWPDHPWGVADLLYERLPMLTVRNYLADYKESDWPAGCWSDGRTLRRGLALCVEFLRDWRAFRPGAARDYQRAIEELVPRVVMRVQRAIAASGATSIAGASRDTGKVEVLAGKMAVAVADISALKKLKAPTPMLGSKVLAFFFPEFFPIWDTAYVKRAIDGLAQRGEIASSAASEAASERGADSARCEYRRYLELFVEDLRRTTARSRATLSETVIRHAVREYRHAFLRDLIEDNLGDLSPFIFELCLIGYGRRAGVW